MQLVDRYDFNYKDKERAASNRVLTWWGHISMTGDSFRILGPEINIRETKYSHSNYPSGNGNGNSGKSEENKGKEF